MYATISADIVSSTSLSVNETIALKKKMEKLFCLLEQKYPNFWGRQIKGDYIECLIPDVRQVFRIALLLKMYVKSMDLKETKEKKLFQTYGIRMAVGIGNMRIVNRKEGIMDGEAIYFSGRGLENMGTPGKGTMTIDMGNTVLRNILHTVSTLTDALLNNATRRQSEVLYYKLLGLSEQEIADTMGIRQSGVNQHASTAKWYCIEEALDFFENLNFTDYE